MSLPKIGKIWFTVLFIFLSMLSACAPAVVKTTMVAPARYHEASQLRTIAVLPFEGRDGKEFSAEIEAEISSVSINDEPYFTLAERTRLDRVISEMKLSQSGLVDQATSVRLGKMVGVKGIYTGEISANSVRDQHFVEERSECIQWEDTKKLLKKCLANREYSVDCIDRQALFSFIPKLTDVESGRIVYSEKIDGAVNGRACQDNFAGMASPAEMIQEAKNVVKKKFRDAIAPHYINVELRMIKDTTGINSDEAEKKFSSGLEFARAGRMDRACELWENAAKLSPSSYGILYDLGLCAELKGDLKDALDFYVKADRQLNSPDETVSMAIRRVTENISKSDKLKQEIGH